MENLGMARRPAGVGSSCVSPGCFWAASDLQTARPRAETKPAEELRSWEKKQRAPLRYGGRGQRGSPCTRGRTCMAEEWGSGWGGGPGQAAPIFAVFRGRWFVARRPDSSFF